MQALVDIQGATALPGAAYLSGLVSRIEQAQSRIWAAIFLVDVRLETDAQLQVREVFDALRRAHWRNVDVRLLIGHSRIFDIQSMSAVTQAYSQAQGIDCRILGKPGRPGEDKKLHAKYVVVDDDWTILGGHNWTSVGFSEANQASMAIESNGVANWLAGHFADCWETAEPAPVSA